MHSVGKSKRLALDSQIIFDIRKFNCKQRPFEKLSSFGTRLNSILYRGADKSLARRGRKPANISVRMT